MKLNSTWERQRLAGKFRPTSDLPARRRRTQGFTLIELLVVIAIIGILASMTLVVIAKVREKGRITEAKREIRALYNAIEEYHSDTSSYPVSDAVLLQAIAAKSDFTFDLPGVNSTNNSEVMAILLNRERYGSGAPTVNLNHAKNKLQKFYLISVPTADSTNLPGLGPDLVYRDPWGKPYVISFDLNFDGDCHDALYEKSSVSKPIAGYDSGLNSTDRTGSSDDFHYRGGVMIWSLGPDKRADANTKANEAPNRDNIVSWR
jgi:prepilin-type N-terminal cleavage/methylation domain-containing protein